MRPAQSLELPGLTLLRPVGSGSFGEVWLARSVTGQFRAVKIVWLRRPDDDAANPALEDLGDRVFRGVQQYLDRIPPGSPAGLAVLHVDRDPAGRFFYYVMELADDAVTGRDIHPESYTPHTLSELRRRSSTGCLSATETLRIGIRLAEGLEMLHRAGLVHRDLKPSNIVFVGGEARIADIDLVRPNEASMSLAGTLGYAPPEGPGRPPGDVYSLARTLYVAVTGLAVGEFPRLPEDWDQRDDADVLRRLNAILLRACDRNPALRPADGASIRAELLRVAAGEDPERSRRLKRWARLASWTAAIAVPTALIAILLARQYQNQVKEKEQALREKTFALYRAYLADAASNFARNQLGNARSALAIAEATGGGRTGIELDLLKRQAEGDSATIIPSVGSSIDQLEFSPDGSLLAAATGNTNVLIFRTDGLPVKTITNVASLGGFLGSGRLIAGTDSSSTNEHVRPLAVWDVATGVQTLNPHPGRWLAIGGDPSSETTFAIDYENRERLLRWNPKDTRAADPIRWHAGLPRDNAKRLPELYAQLAKTNSQLLYRQSVELDVKYTSQLFLTSLSDRSTTNLTAPGRKINAIAISPDGSRSAYAEENLGTIALFRTTNGFEPLATLRDAQTTAMRFSPDGRTLAVGTVDQRVQLRNADTLAVEQTLFGHTNWISALAWDPKGSLLASGDRDGEIRIWNLFRSKTEPAPDVMPGFKAGSGTAQLIASPDETWIAVSASTNSVALVRVAEFTRGKTLDAIQIPLVFDPSGDGLWALNSNGALVRVDTTTGAETKRLKGLVPKIGSTAGQASKDGSRLLLYCQEWVSIWKKTTEGYEELKIAASPAGEPIMDVAISEDAHWGITVGWKESATLWNLDSGKALSIGNSGGQGQFTAACFFPGTSLFVLAQDNGALFRSDIRSPTSRVELPGNLDSPAQLLPLPDGKRLLVAGERSRLGVALPEDGQTLVWFTHRQLNAEPGEHALIRLLYLSGTQSGIRRLYALTQDGLLVRW